MEPSDFSATRGEQEGKRKVVIRLEKVFDELWALPAIAKKITEGYIKGIEHGAKWWVKDETGKEDKVYVVIVYDESAVVLNGDQVYNDGIGWTVDQVAEAIAHQLQCKVETIDATAIADRNRDYWNWPDVIAEALEK